jgi:hypothetical protein
VIRVFTFVYGRHLELLKRSLSSLDWPKNKKALERATWSVYTTKEDEGAVLEILGDRRVEITITRASIDIGAQQSKCLLSELTACYQRRAAMLLSPPDTIFGDGTIQTLISLGEGNNAIAAPHPRVVLETFPELRDPTSNAKLVSLAFEHMHEVWRLSNTNLAKNNVYGSGTAWREISQNLYGVTMRIPTIYFIRPASRDVETLEAAGSGGWDHKWPQHLIKEQRHRIVGSSDGAFMVELSPLNLPQGKTRDINWDEPDEYSGKLLHHQVNRNTVTIWRAE